MEGDRERERIEDIHNLMNKRKNKIREEEKTVRHQGQKIKWKKGVANSAKRLKHNQVIVRKILPNNERIM